MEGIKMKKINATFSLPKETNDLLHALVARQKLSAFVADAISKALEEKKQALRRDYLEAENDPGRKEAIKEWKGTEGEDWE